MESTHLDLLTRDGKLSMTFWPELEADHCHGLVELSAQCDGTDQLRDAIGIAARAWFREVEFSE